MKSSSIERLHERFGILQARYGYSLLDAESFAGFAQTPGTTLILLQTIRPRFRKPGT